MADHASGPLRLLVQSRREQVMAIASRHHASRVRLFGSAARGDERPDSDIDLLVDFDEDSSLFDLMRMSRELEALLGRPVDVVSAGGANTRIGAELFLSPRTLEWHLRKVFAKLGIASRRQLRHALGGAGAVPCGHPLRVRRGRAGPRPEQDHGG